MTYFSNRWWTMGRQNAAATEAYAPSGSTNTHYAPVVAAEKVGIAGQKARALTVMSGMLREKRGGNGASTASSRPRSKSSTC